MPRTRSHRNKSVQSKFFSSKEPKIARSTTSAYQKSKTHATDVDELCNDSPVIKKKCLDESLISSLQGKPYSKPNDDPSTSASLQKLKIFELQPATSSSLPESSEENSKEPNSFDTRGQQCGPASLHLKYTPLELQVLELKAQYPDAVLFVECGYKYRFFGEDAEIASKVLKIMCNPDHNMMTASIPVHRLPIHIHRMVSAGYKVGVVKQTETQYLKAASDNKSGPFSRELSSLFTKSTLIGQGTSSLNEASISDSSLPNQYLMCVSEQSTKEPKRNIGLVCVDPSTGDIIIDEFQERNLYQELETRISHLQPAEIVLSASASEGLRNFILKVAELSSTPEDKIRVELIAEELVSPSNIFNIIYEFYKEDQCSLQSVLNFSKPVITCLATLCIYLKDFRLDKLLRVTSNFQKFSQRSHCMLLNSQAVRNLELLHNSWDGSEKGSLFWLLNQTSSAFGARLLRKWILQPLLDVGKIQGRLESVEEIVGGSWEMFSNVKQLLKKIPDLEKGLNSVFHQRCSPQEFFSLLQAFNKVRIACLGLETFVTSALLHSLVSKIQVNLIDVQAFSQNIRQEAARENDITNLFLNTEQYPLIHECKRKMDEIRHQLDNHLVDVRSTLGQPGLKYASVFKTEYLIEVKQSQIASVPKDWRFINSTNSVSRYHTPHVADQYCRLKELGEELVMHAQSSWQELLLDFSSNYLRYKQAVTDIATLDCLMSLATVASQDSYCKPQIACGPTHITIAEGRHPIIDNLKQGQEQFVPNSTHLHSAEHRVQVITGPNMGGKSSYLRQVALIVIMAQIGSYVPAAHVSIGIVDAVFISMGSSDRLFKGQSTFMVELLEVSDILAQITDRSLVILDELGRGTSTHDGVAIAHATLEHFITKSRCLLVFVTHFPMLLKLCQLYPASMINSYMAVQFNENSADSDSAITFLYQLTDGCAAKSYGLNVARLASLPESILSLASQKALQLEKQMSSKGKFIEMFKADSQHVQTLLKELTKE